jgi:hypothetical protein
MKLRESKAYEFHIEPSAKFGTAEVKAFGSDLKPIEAACPCLHILDESVQVHVMHIAV